MLPNLEEFYKLLQDIWDRQCLSKHRTYNWQQEEALANFFKVPYVSLFTNGTLTLNKALQAQDIHGEVIITPYVFVATTHALWWNGIKPVFR